MLIISVDPAVYPAFDIYASGKGSVLEYWREETSVSLEAVYPVMNICEPASSNGLF